MADFTDIIQEINTNLPDNNTQSITAEKLRTTLIDLTNTIDTQQNNFESNVNTSLSNIVVDNLTSTDTDKALSANQGKILNDSLVEESISKNYFIDITEENFEMSVSRNIDSEGNWTGAVSGTSYKIISINPGDVIHLTWDGTSRLCAVLQSKPTTSSPTGSANLSTAEGFTSRFSSSAKPNFTVPEDGRYFWYCEIYKSSGSSTPQVTNLRVHKQFTATKGVFPTLYEYNKFNSGQNLENVNIKNDFSGGINDVLSAEQGKVLNHKIEGDFVNVSPYPGISSGYPARTDGSYESTGYYGRYTLDLTGYYAQGYRKVRFWGVNSTINNTICQGVIGTAINNNVITVEVINDVPNHTINTVTYNEGWCELPITENSKILAATLLTTSGINNVGSNYSNPTFVPDCVYLIGEVPGLRLQINELNDRVEELEDGNTGKYPTVFLPRKTYGVIGDTLQMFLRGMVCSFNPYDMYSKILCGQGRVYRRYFQITPTLENSVVPTNLTISHRFIDNYYNSSPVKTSQLVLAQKPTTSPEYNINVLCIGASTTAGGQWPAELRRRLTSSDDATPGYPAGDNLSNITFVGRIQTSSNINVEATGGWTWSNFYTPRTAFRFNCTDVNNPVNTGDTWQYKDSGNTWRDILVSEVNITETSGTILFTFPSGQSQSSSNYPVASGTLRKKSSTSITVSYSSYTTETFAPFYDNTKPNNCGFTNYVNTYCDGSLDVAIFFIGSINAGIVGKSSTENALNNMKIVLDSLHRDYPNCKVIMATVKGLSTYYGMEYTFGANSTYDTWSGLYGEFRYTQDVEDFISGDDYKDWCFFANTLGEVDSENVYPTADKAVNTRMPDTTEKYGTNGQHSSLPGYLQVADCMYRCFVNTILN